MGFLYEAMMAVFSAKAATTVLLLVGRLATKIKWNLGPCTLSYDTLILWFFLRIFFLCDEFMIVNV